MRKFLIVSILFLTGGPLLAANFYVAPDGNDSNPGTLEKPFATLPRAQRETREKAGREAVTILLRGGVYYLADTFVLTAQDSGTSQFPVIYQAYADEKPVISGGTRLHLTWTSYTHGAAPGIMQASVPPGLATDQLFVNGQRQQMARFPNFDPTAQYFDGFAPDAFSKERAARWADPAGGFIHAMHRALWGDYSYRITGKDALGNVTYEGGWQNNRQSGMHDKIRYVENIFEELDVPGEWFLNSKTSKLYFFPPQGVDLTTATIEAVRLPCLVEFRGDQKQPVRFVSFKGLTFRHAARTFMDNREPLLRSDWTIYRGGAVFCTGTEDCSVEDCFLDQLGGNSIFVNKYNRRFTIRGCHIADGGANGVAFIGDPKAARNPLFEYSQRQGYETIDKTPGPQADDYPADCLVDDCLIHHTGRVEKQTAGVAIDLAQNITVRHCSIYDVPRAGINIGDGCWGGNIVEFCDVFDTVLETGDNGSFNSWGRDRYWQLKDAELNEKSEHPIDLPRLDAVKPNVLRNSRWRCDHGWDIDLDDGSTNYEIRDNLCLHGGIKNREGYDRIVENNVMVGGFCPHVWFNDSQDVVRFNIIFGGYHPALMRSKPWGKEMDFNILCKPGQTAPMPAAALQSLSGRDQHSIEVDPMFIDPASGDYRVAEKSPAIVAGFKNFPMDQFGVQKASLRAIARTPRFPGAGEGSIASHRNARVAVWEGIKVRNIVGMGEMSAYGLPGETGVLVLEIPADSPFGKAGLMKDDVILSCDAKKIDQLRDLLSQKPAAGQRLSLGIFRGQHDRTITLQAP